MAKPELQSFPRVGNYSFILDVEGHSVKVTYRFSPFGSIDNPEYLKLYKQGENYHHVHFEFFGTATSETGYRSHYTPLVNVDCPFKFASELSAFFHDQIKKLHPKLSSPQLNLF